MRQLTWLICDLGYVAEVTEALAGGTELVNVLPQAAMDPQVSVRTVGGLSASATRREGDPRRARG